MKKTFVMFFLLGLMVSCASQQERSVSSVKEDVETMKKYDHPHYETRGSYR